MPRRADRCAHCDQAFEVGETFQGFLYEGDETYERRDFHLACPVPVEPRPVAGWRTKRPEPTTPKAQPFDREAIFNFFLRLENPETPHQLQFRFVLALLLWRKKVLKLVGTAEDDGREYWEFHNVQGELTHQVERPALDEEQLEALSRQLEELLADTGAALTAAELDPEAAPTPATPEEPA
jgi:hypothetical protein